MNYGYIYKTTNLINGKIYIGQYKSNLFDSQYKGSGVILRKAFAKYGKENSNVKGYRWYTDGVNNIRCPEGKQPDNYQLGKSGTHHNQYTKK